MFVFRNYGVLHYTDWEDKSGQKTVTWKIDFIWIAYQRVAQDAVKKLHKSIPLFVFRSRFVFTTNDDPM